MAKAEGNKKEKKGAKRKERRNVPHGVAHILWLRFLLVVAGWNINVNPGPNSDRILNAGNRASRLALHVICRKSLARKFRKTRLLIVLHFASETKDLFRCKIPEDRLADTLDIRSQPWSAAIVVDHDFQEV